ncbi:hypothetical protein [Pleomorphomonas sp. JP5]|uniref:hypothetical protein n=1 Tax=Pleomorphomonas sp. JP5 TaxID=2942998 RepID=UPI002043DB5C|nr:hypothetical protein [Pleomorphomonas sp. JP5]MCM5557320.1 hypothetical protein [Pleomorphomonas sp. JP5]
MMLDDRPRPSRDAWSTGEALVESEKLPFFQEANQSHTLALPEFVPLFDQSSDTGGRSEA